jgi:hypothetical protein
MSDDAMHFDVLLTLLRFRITFTIHDFLYNNSFLLDTFYLLLY